MRARPVTDAAQARDNVLGDTAIVGQLPAQLLDHAVDVVELGLVACRGGHRGRGAHVGAVDAVDAGIRVMGLLLRVVLLLRL